MPQIIESTIVCCERICQSTVVYLQDMRGDRWRSEYIPVEEYKKALAQGAISGHIDFSKYCFAPDDNEDRWQRVTGLKEPGRT